MAPPEVWKRWKVAQANLRHARAMLPAPEPKFAAEHARLLAHYQSYLKQNELELALDMLQELGELQPCPGGYWRNLERAAEVMELVNRVPYFRKRFEMAGKECG